MVAGMKPQETTHWAIRIPLDDADRVELIRQQLTVEYGFPVTRTDALKTLLLKGIEAFRKERQVG
jgi:hypothetical protein